MKITNIGQKGIDLIAFFESFKPKPYICPAGIITIGEGTTRYFDTKRRVSLNDKPITKEEGRRLLIGDIKTVFIPLVDSLCRDDLTQNEFDAICSFVYNAGVTYRGKDGKIHYYNIFENINNKMSKEELTKYWSSLAITGGGKILPGLINRRKKEVELYFTK